jgi:hypothetical protein
MKLYLISQTVNDGYDTYDKAIVCASNKKEAVNIHPNGERYNPLSWEQRVSWVCDKKDIKIKLVGTTKRKKAGVVLASCRAG